MDLPKSWNLKRNSSRIEQLTNLYSTPTSNNNFPFDFIQTMIYGFSRSVVDYLISGTISLMIVLEFANVVGIN